MQTEMPEPTEQSSTILLISGSRYATAAMLKFAAVCVERAAENGWFVMVGDSDGVDRAVREACVQFGASYTVVVVDGHNRLIGEPGTTARQYGFRDQLMCEFADRGMFIWNGESRGTKTAYDYFLTRPNKIAHLRVFSNVSKGAILSEDYQTDADALRSEWS